MNREDIEWRGFVDLKNPHQNQNNHNQYQPYNPKCKIYNPFDKFEYKTEKGFHSLLLFFKFTSLRRIFQR